MLLFSQDNGPFRNVIKLTYDQLDQIVSKFRKFNNISNFEQYGKTVDAKLFVRATGSFYYEYKERLASSQYAILFSG